MWKRISLVTPSASHVDAPATAGVRLTNAGVQESRKGATYTSVGNWLAMGTAGDYEARCTVAETNGVGLNQGSAFATWLSLSSSLEWRVTATLGNTATRDFTVEIRRASDGAVLASETGGFIADAA